MREILTLNNVKHTKLPNTTCDYQVLPATAPVIARVHPRSWLTAARGRPKLTVPHLAAEPVQPLDLRSDSRGILSTAGKAGSAGNHVSAEQRRFEARQRTMDC